MKYQIGTKQLNYKKMSYLDKLKKAIWQLENQNFPADQIIGINSSLGRFRFQFGCNIAEILESNNWRKYDETANLHYFKHENSDFEIVCDK